MPTDGADFGRMKACYGKAFTAARLGAEDSEVAEIVIAGLERDIRRDGGSPAFPQAVDLLVLIMQSLTSTESRSQHLLDGVEQLRCDFADSPLTRHVAAAVETTGLACINGGRPLSKSKAAEMVLSHLARSRCCDGMTPYLTKNRTQSALESNKIVSSIIERVARTVALPNLAHRMLTGSAGGLPTKQPKGTPISYSVNGLYNDQIGGA